MQEKVEIITNHFEHYWTKIPKNGYCAVVKKSQNLINVVYERPLMAEMPIVGGLRGLVLVGFLDLVADGIGKLFDNLCL